MHKSTSNVHKLSRYINAIAIVFSLAMTYVQQAEAQKLLSRKDSAERCQIVTGPNVQVSRESGRVLEPWIAVNPRNPRNLIVAAQATPTNGPPISDGVYFYSSNGGKSWDETSPRLQNGKDDEKRIKGSDHATLFSKAGTALYFTMAVQSGSAKTENMVHRSGDFGRSTDGKILPALHFWKPAADLTVNRNTSGNVYTYGSDLNNRNPVTGEGAQLDLLRSSDDGKTWTRHQIVSAKMLGLPVSPEAPAVYRFDASSINGFVANSGKLIMPFQLLTQDKSPFKTNFTHWVTTSNDGGNTFTKPIQLKKSDESNLLENNSGYYFALDTSGGIFGNRLYATWVEESRSGGQSRLLFSSSVDEGSNWSEPIVIENELIGDLSSNARRPVLPSMVVNNQGIIIVSGYRFGPEAWSSAESGAKTRKIRYRRYVSASLDGGASFLPAVPLATKTSEFTVSMQGSSEEYLKREERRVALADYLNTAPDTTGTFHEIWMDGRTGIQQLWYAPIRVLCNNKAAVARKPANLRSE